MMNDLPKKVAVLGASGHIGKNVTEFLREDPEYQLYLFVRSRGKMVDYLRNNGSFPRSNLKVLPFEDFRNGLYDVVINCVGIGNPNELTLEPYRIFQVTEEFDNLVLDYIRKHPKTLYINFSSGAIYGTDFAEAASQTKCASIDVNQLGIKDYYGISKLHMEAKHRSLPDHYIVDIRIFGFFSRYIDMGSRFFLTDVVNSLNDNKALMTNSQDMVRDYVHPSDLKELMELCIHKHSINAAYDAYSLEPVTKFELLDYFISEHNLHVQYRHDEPSQSQSVTGAKNNYYSINKSAAEIGYTPNYSSMQCIADVVNLLKTGKSNA
ncbi:MULTISPECIES: NAD(P)-dependent oxidoreductase [Paenibacillus]|uniref:NAD-dependent epimerase/dehydratase family protein n=1 Tax=Paenibacillus TaxID=44249 RepID=UPI002FE17000